MKTINPFIVKSPKGVIILIKNIGEKSLSNHIQRQSLQKTTSIVKIKAYNSAKKKRRFDGQGTKQSNI